MKNLNLIRRYNEVLTLYLSGWLDWLVDGSVGGGHWFDNYLNTNFDRHQRYHDGYNEYQGYINQHGYYFRFWKGGERGREE